ncbi:helix-turn-helix domain-containing protein [Dactylosporangium sp. NPDC000555]|uniref:helix-turn-helix domain-containing protein n=1 Tax=Dactylosporangium sp. NPDC000555 TaxID=3154260 RepID=UPI0033268D84
MDGAIEQAVRRAIVTMRENLGEELTVDDMARAAMFSKFHFTRIFQRATGVSPGRFLSALRLQRAKQLLVSTSMNVADISLLVGYKSVGTFSSRFSRSVGLSPTTYRRTAGYAFDIPTANRGRPPRPSSASVYGEIRHAAPNSTGVVFIGLFPDRIPEGAPVRCSVLPGRGTFSFEMVPTGSWYVLAQSVGHDAEALVRDDDRTGQSVSVATYGPITVREDTMLRLDLELEPVRVVDPPVLLALLDVRKLALARTRRQAGFADPIAA